MREKFENQSNPNPGEKGYNIHRGDFRENREKEWEIERKKREKYNKDVNEFIDNLPKDQEELERILKELGQKKEEAFNNLVIVEGEGGDSPSGISRSTSEQRREQEELLTKLNLLKDFENAVEYKLEFGEDIPEKLR